MSTYAAAAPAISGPAEERHAFLKKTALWSFLGLSVAAVVGIVSMFTIAPLAFSIPYGGTVAMLGTFFFAHYVCRRMVYGQMKVPGFILACIAEGISFGLLLLVTISIGKVSDGVGVVVQALAITAATAGAMLVYVWFNKGELKMLRAFLSIAFVPMLILMAVSLFFPLTGPVGLVLCGLFVLVSAAALLYRLNVVVHTLGTDQHVEGAFEMTMGLLVLLWNVLSLLNRVRR